MYTEVLSYEFNRINGIEVYHFNQVMSSFSFLAFHLVFSSLF